MNPYFRLHCPCGCNRLAIVKDAKSGEYDVECCDCEAVIARLRSYAIEFEHDEKEDAHAHPTE